MPGTPLGSVALLAVLAITTGWTTPPAGPLDSLPAAADTANTAGVKAAIAAALAALSERIAARATIWDAAWDRRAAASTTPPVVEAAPAEAPPPAGPTDGARTVTLPLGPTGSARTFEGRNHFWVPDLGMSKKVVAFPCPRTRPPDHYIYRWGCAQRNNVYILGHASSVMKPLHDAYVAGRLRVGMVAIYADGQGRIRAYRVTEWRVVDPAEGVWWAIAAQPVPSMTLQTCVGANNQWRLNVRLVAID